jgi:hypothetical protein
LLPNCSANSQRGEKRDICDQPQQIDQQQARTIPLEHLLVENKREFVSLHSSQKHTATYPPMSSFTESSNPRNRDELEGTLLPVAQAIRSDQQGDFPSTTSDGVAVAAATPVSYFVYDSVPEDEIQVVRDAAVIPSADQLLPSEEAQRSLFAYGERAGLIDNERQKEDIQKANQQVNSINYFTKKQIDHANQRAVQLSLEERHGPRPTNELERAAARPTLGQDNQTKTPTAEAYGKDYDVAEYATNEYQTIDYGISEYKSIYES